MAAVISNGASLSIAGSEVGLVTSISLSVNKETVDVTALDSTTWKSFVSGFAEGEASIEVNYDPSAHTTFMTTLVATTASAIVITFPDDAGSGSNATFTFNAWLTSFEPGAAVDDRLTASCTFKPTGSITEGTS